ncbi:arsenate reductase (glutaredoxin) [Lysobacteraceae bacterium NML03-0222]|nr:arsenate reductase (glutaredoxin) [Xanthomonadaceae bacterium NML03-0222]
MPMRYYHNPRCSKSRQALALLHERGIEPELVAYLDTPPDADTLRALLGKLGISARQLLRTGEEAYKAYGLDNPALDEQAIIAAMVEAPILIERPIFENGDKAVIGRPPERVLEIL